MAAAFPVVLSPGARANFRNDPRLGYASTPWTAPASSVSTRPTSVAEVRFARQAMIRSETPPPIELAVGNQPTGPMGAWEK